MMSEIATAMVSSMRVKPRAGRGMGAYWLAVMFAVSDEGSLSWV